MHAVAFIALAMLVSFAAQAQSGLFGGTREVSVEVDSTATASLLRSVRLGSVVIAGANEIDSVGTFHVGDFDDKEREIIEQALTAAFASVPWPGGSEQWDVHVVIRHYYVAHSNNDGGIVAGVAWAMIESDDRIVFSDEFYAAAQKSDMERRRTLGHLKELINTAIVDRVAQTSLRLAGAEDPTAVSPVATHLTHASVQEAAVGMPENLKSAGGFGLFARKGNVDWAEGAPVEPHDWERWLAQR
jgi:hypothetical protein